MLATVKTEKSAIVAPSDVSDSGGYTDPSSQKPPATIEKAPFGAFSVAGL
jgi:hypothetical protein